MNPYQQRPDERRRQYAQPPRPSPGGGGGPPDARPPPGGQQPPGRGARQEPPSSRPSGTAQSRYAAGAATASVGLEQVVQPIPVGQETTGRAGPSTSYGSEGARSADRSAPDRFRVPIGSVEDVVETDVVTARPSTPISSVVTEMRERDVGSVVVVEGEVPVGVVTDRTVALALADDPDVSERDAGDLLGETLVTGSMDMSVMEAIERMRREGVRRLPLVDENRSLDGIVTLDDLLVLLAREFRAAAEVLEAQSSRR